jgi:SAM-dependent methyltransferase
MTKTRSVSNVWNELLKEGGAYSTKDMGKDLLRKALSSRWISSLLKDESSNRFLEAGCGLGRFGIAIASSGKDVTLVDCSNKSLDSARRLNEIAEKYFGKMNVIFVKDDLEHTRFEDNRFDVTFNEGVIEHWLDYDSRVKIIKEMIRITRNGGLVSIRVVNNRNFLYNLLYLMALKPDIPMHHRYNIKGLSNEMRDAGLEVVYCDGEMVNDPGNWARNRALSGFLVFISNAINRLPKFLRQRLCPSIFCTGVVKK